MTSPVPLGPEEELLWRALIRVATTLPRVVDSDISRDSGLSASAYAVLVHLSEVPGRHLRMSELAARTVLSASRISRVVEDLSRAGLVTKARCAEDGRGNLAGLTDAGLARLRAAYPMHLARVRERVVDHLSPAEVASLGPVLARLAEALDGSALLDGPAALDGAVDAGVAAPPSR
ncbi:MAG TPA: MarR family winged helix-turn-helix transcriptional regulator [Pilimelia sp.]|nr:MarR family winged helix-turn-helix transcriptional regulator [Pilimelia sp.]